MNIELAKRAVACKHWRWMPGMRVVRDNAWSEPLSQRVSCTVPNGGYPDAWPDLTDPATLGCLLALVREAWGDTLAVCIPRSHTNWEVRLVPLHGWTHCAWGNSEIEALVAALEATP
jgi:hypothetical protein